MFAGELSDENRGEHGEKLLNAKIAKKGAKDARKRDSQHKGAKQSFAWRVGCHSDCGKREVKD
jgi:hypothetical protein